MGEIKIKASESQYDTTKSVYTLTQLNESLSNHIKKNFAHRRFWITCELTSINSKGGHHYLQLADSKDGIKTANADATIWSSDFRIIEEKLLKEGEDIRKILQKGNKIMIEVIIDYHGIYGLKLMIKNLDATYTLGDIEKQKKVTLDRLKKEGLLGKQSSIFLGSINKRIALIGSKGSSGYTDFYSELLEHNNIYRKFKLIEFDVRVQGDYAVDEISKAIEMADAYDVDAIVLVRGGGSKMDLHVFNHYDICKAIANANHPVLVGIGHETDNTLSDSVAKRSEKTPTAVAKFLYESIGIFSAERREVFDRVKMSSLEIIREKKNQYQLYSNQLHNLVVGRLKSAMELLLRFTNEYREASIDLVAVELRRLNNRQQHIANQGRFHLEAGKQYVQNVRIGLMKVALEIAGGYRERRMAIFQNIAGTIQTRLIQEEPGRINQTFKIIGIRAESLISDKKNELNTIIRIVSTVDPTALFSKGYTISTIEGIDVQNYNEDLIGKEMKTISGRHTITSTVRTAKTTDND